MTDNNTEYDQKETLRALNRGDAPRSTARGGAGGYSRFIRWMRFILPAAAIAILVIVVSWSGMEDAVKPAETTQSEQAIGKNELVNPRFESQDQKNQPYTITATRAFQDPENLDLVMLENPVADIALKDGNWVALEATSGEYRQGVENLMLRQNVKMYHDDGYTIVTDMLVIDIRGQVAETDSPVNGHGPMGSISAQGLKAIGTDGKLIFKGPATLILNQEMDMP